MGKEKREQSNSAVLNIFISILTIFLLFITSFQAGKFQFGNEELLQMGYVALGAIVFALVVNWRAVAVYFNRIKSKINLFLNIVIEYRRGHLEFLDMYGKKAMYNEECLFNRIRRKEIYNSTLRVDGKIDNKIHTYNCYNSLNHTNNELTIVYGKKNENKNIVYNKRQLHFGYVATLLDSYPDEREFWGTEVKHYTKVYELKISFHKQNPPKNVCIFDVKIDKKGKEILTPLHVDPLIMQKYNRTVMKIKLLHLQKGNRFRVYWNWKKKP